MAGNTQKIIIAEVSDNTVWYKYFPYYANVWLVQTNNDYTGISDPDFELENIGLDSELNVISFSVFKRNYKRVETIAGVISEKSSFYFNNSTKQLLVHFEHHKPYYYFDQNTIEIGFALGFFNTNSASDGEWESTQYAPRLLNFPTFKDTLDDLFHSKQRYQSAEIEIDNYDLKYKNFNIGSGIKKKNGNLVRILQWTGEDSTQALYSEFEVKYQGVIERIIEGRTIRIGMRDIRSSLTIKSPQRYLDTTEYPSIKDPDKEYLIPELWGKCYDVPCVCLNEDINDGDPLGTTAYEYMICDTEHHTIASDSITVVYVNGKKVIATPTVTFNSTQQFATFSLEAKVNFSVVDEDGDFRYENMDKVTIDVEGYLKGDSFRESDGGLTTTPDELINNGLAILREIIRNNYGYEYTDTYYEISEWEALEDDAYTVGYYIDKQTEVQKQIEELASSQLGKFIWNAELKFSFRNNDFDTFEMEIPKHKFYPEDYMPTFEEDSTQVQSIIRVGNKRKWSQSDDELQYEWLVDDSNQETALVDYASTQTKDFHTLIDNQTDAQDYATRSLVYVGISKDTFTILTDWSHKDLKSGDWVKVQADHSTENILGWTKCQIQEVAPQIGTWQVQLKLRIFGYYKELLNNDETANIINNDNQKILVEG